MIAKTHNLAAAPVCKLLARRGIASVLAMLFLVLFSTLAVGFFVASTMSSQIARNNQSLSLAQAGAEAGTQFVRYQLDQIVIAPSVTTSGLLTAAAQQLGNTGIGCAGLNNTPNMNGNTVQVVNDATFGPTIYIPSATGWTAVDSNTGIKFRARINQSGQFLVSTVEGAGPGGTVGTIAKAIQLQFQKAPKAGQILDYGVAAAGTVDTEGHSLIQGATDPTKGSVLSADVSSNPAPITINGQGVSGDLSIVNTPPAANIVVGNSVSVGGTNNPNLIQSQHEHTGVPPPQFPWIDTSPYVNAANASATPINNTWTYGNNATVTNVTLTNQYIPPGVNPTFAGNATINGVLVIAQPNQVTFTGNANINGVIVQQPPASGPISTPVPAGAPGTSGTYNAQNQINFQGTVNVTPLSALPATNPAYDPNLIQLTGAFLLAPSFALSMTGNSDIGGSFGTIGGSIVAGTVNMSGHATGTVNGSVIAVYDSSASGSGSSVYLNGNSDITISSTGTSNYPTGINFGNNYTPLAGTYIEVAPW